MEVENGAGVASVFRYLAVEMDNVLPALNAQGISQTLLHYFDGSLKKIRNKIKLQINWFS